MQALEELHMNVDHNMRSTATTKAQARSHTTTTRYEVGQNVTAARVGKIETPRPYLPFTDLNPCLPGFFLSLQALAEMDEGSFFAPEDRTLEEKLLSYDHLSPGLDWTDGTYLRHFLRKQPLTTIIIIIISIFLYIGRVVKLLWGMRFWEY